MTHVYKRIGKSLVFVETLDITNAWFKDQKQAIAIANKSDIDEKWVEKEEKVASKHVKRV